MPAPSPATLRKRLEAEVAALFRKAPAAQVDANGDRSVPAIVLAGRRKRAVARVLDALVSRGSVAVPKEVRGEIRDLLRRWSGLGFADGFEAVERFEIRCAQEREIVVAREAGDPEKLLDALERDYRRRVVERFGKAELRGVQTSHRVVQDLETVFVPLHLEPSPVLKEGQESDLQRLFFGPRLAVPATLKQHKKTLLVGAPGSGKTTLLAYLATRAAQGRELGASGWPKAILPFVLTVRALENARLTPAAVAKHTGCDAAVAERALASQKALLLIDGLDEAPEVLRDQLVASVGRLVQKRPDVRIVATSRPSGAPGEVEQSLPFLEPFRIADLQRHEADDFIDRWCLAAELSLQPDEAVAKKEAARAANDLKSRLAESYAVQKIAVSPLLLNILCIVHRFLGQRIPEHRVTLYERCTDALLYEWDRAKFPEGSAVGALDAPAKRRLLMGVARKIHGAHAAEIAESEVQEHFAAKLPGLGRPASDAQTILAEIRDRSGLLVERRPGYFAFSHLTFQEYFCALDFVDRKKTIELVAHFEDRWWHEVIVLAAGAPGAPPGAVVKFLLAKKALSAIFLAAQCLETAPETPLAIRKRVEEALEDLVPPKTLAEVDTLLRLGTVEAPSLMRTLNSGNLPAPALTLLALGCIDYAPAIPTLARFVGDVRPGDFLSSDFTTGGVALLMLVGIAAKLDIARQALRAVIARADPGQIRLNLDGLRLTLGSDDDSPQSLGRKEVIAILDDALKAARRARKAPAAASAARSPANGARIPVARGVVQQA